MNKFISLTKVIMKSGFGETNSMMGKKKNNKKSINNKILYGVLALCMVPVFAMMFMSGGTMYQVFSQTGQVAMGYQTIAGMGSLLLLIFATPYVMSTFFMSSDINTLLTLPIKPSMIVGAKFTAVSVWQYLMVAIFVAPMLIGYTFAAGAGILSWVLTILSIFLIVLTPNVYASLFAIILARLLKNVKNKEMIVTMSTMLVVFAAIGLSMFSQNSMNSGMMASLATQGATINGLSYIFPNTFVLAKALGETSIVYMLLYVLTVVAVVALFLVVGEKLYIGGVSAMGERSKSNKALSSAQKDKLNVKRSPVSAVARKELKTLFRSPEYLLNCLLMPMIMPIVMIVIGAVSGMQAMKQHGGDSANFDQMLDGLKGSSNLAGTILLVCVGMSFLASSMNMTTVTCISREGKGFINMKFIPISYKDQIKGKLLAGEVVGLATALPIPVILLVVSVAFFGVNPAIIPIGIFGTVLSFMICNYFQMLVDLFSPKLNWETEQGAVKQNFNTFISVMGIMIVGGLSCFGLAMLYNKLQLTIYLFSAIAGIILLVVTFLMRLWVYKYGEKKLRGLE